MTHRERILATFKFGPTDRLPCDLMEGIVWSEVQADFMARRGLATAEAVQDFLDTDLRTYWGALSAPDGAPANPHPPGFLPKAVAHGPLAAATTVAEVEAFPWPRPERWSAPDFAAARQRWPDHALMFAAGWLPLFWGACEVFGVEQALVNMLTAPAVFEACLRQEHEFCLAALRRGLPGAARHFDICLLGDDFCSQQAMLLSPADWRKFIKPLLAEQVRLARASGLRVLYHSCGAVRPVIGDLLDIGVNGLLVFQVNAAGMEAESVAREFGGKLVFYGGIDVQHLLSFGTPAEVRATVHSIARAFAGRGGYIVANAHHCVATIRGENIEAMCQAAREFKA